MLSIYPACFYEEDNGYSVIFPDLNYLATDGKNLEEAMKMAIDCLAGYLFTTKLDNETLVKPSKLNSIDAYKIAKELGFESNHCFVNLVSVDVDAYTKIHFNKSIKKTLTIPEWLNKIAMSKHINFSQVLQEALIAKINEK